MASHHQKRSGGGADLSFRKQGQISLERPDANSKDIRKKRHGPLYTARIKCAHFLSRHTTLDNILSFLFRRKWWALLLCIWALVVFCTFSRSRSATKQGVVSGSTSGISVDNSPKDQLKKETLINNNVQKPNSSLRKTFVDAFTEEEDKSRSEDDAEDHVRIIPHKKKLTDGNIDSSKPLPNPRNRKNIQNDSPKSRVHESESILKSPVSEKENTQFLATTTRMIGAFATSTSGSGGIYADSKIHYFPALMEVYKTQREVEMSDDEFDRWKNPKKSRYYRHNAADPMTEGCEPMYEWQEHSFPTCNSLHESGLADLMKECVPRQVRSSMSNATMTTRDPDPRVRMVNNGYWRDVWLVDEWSEDSGAAQRVVKTIRYEHEYTHRNYERHRRDAVAMERLTGSPFVVDIYGFCANSGLFEFSPGGDVVEAVLPRKKNKQKPGYKPKRTREDGDLSSFQKLLIAVQVSLGVKDLHNFIEEGRPSIAHTDITPSQFVEVKGFYKLNDFNRARFLAVNKKTKETCPYKVGNNPGTFRAPEEYKYDSQTEKVDVYSMGNIFYFLLSKEWPFESLDSEDAQKKIIGGERPDIPKEARDSEEPAIAAIVSAIRKCWIQDPAERATAAEVSDGLVAQFRQEKGFREEYLRPGSTFDSDTLGIKATNVSK